MIQMNLNKTIKICHHRVTRRNCLSSPTCRSKIFFKTRCQNEYLSIKFNKEGSVANVFNRHLFLAIPFGLVYSCKKLSKYLRDTLLPQYSWWYSHVWEKWETTQQKLTKPDESHLKLGLMFNNTKYCIKTKPINFFVGIHDEKREHPNQKK